MKVSAWRRAHRRGRRLILVLNTPLSPDPGPSPACRPGELVVEYVGEVIDKASWEGRKKALWRFDHMYFMSLNQNEIVDATRKGNIARFINHSCSPNLQVEKWYVHRTPRLGLWAKRFIAAGEELSYNYSVKWSGDPEFAQRCYCGSERCTGSLGAPPRHKR